jgi:hypothetical protein
VLRAEESSLFGQDPARDWGRLAAGGYDLHYLEGSATGFSQEPQPRLIAELLSAALVAAQAGAAHEHPA